MHQTFNGRVLDTGVIEWENPDAFKSYVRTLIGKFITVKLARFTNTRTNEQNKLLWVINTAIAKETGHTPEEIHEVCKLKFLAHHAIIANKLTGEMEEVTFAGSTAKLNITAFGEYIESVQNFAATLGIIIQEGVTHEA